MPNTLCRAVVAALLTTLCALVPAAMLAPTASAAPSAGTTQAVAAKDHAGLRCRSHKAETNGPSGRVNVPKKYCYDPKTTTNPGWHDYCTHSPDAFFSADFRGPCARHDMCLQGGKGHHVCDARLLKQLYTNCDFAYGKLNPSRYACHATAQEYYGYIKIWTAATS